MGNDSQRVATVLVADSDEDDLSLLNSVLALKGFDVLGADDGQKAVDLAMRWRPDLILIELKLPIISGFTAIRRIKKVASLRDIPVIAVSTSHPTSHRQLALAAGCAAHLDKPIDFDQLDALINEFLPGFQWELASVLVH
jgi:two-component system, cell cycle response regulator DivK